MKVVILQSNYIPWRGYFDLINCADVFCFYDEVKYTKNDWRNRNKIYSKNGLHWLTIPIEKDAVKQRISEVTMPKAWEKKHVDTLQMTYGRAPFFFQLNDIIENIYANNKYQNLSDFNQNFIKYISRLLGFKTKFINSADYDLRGDKVERLINLLTDIGATEYISGPSAKNYLYDKELLFSTKKINLTYMKYGPYPEYKQLGGAFEPAVSILDTIANVSYENIKNHFE